MRETLSVLAGVTFFFGLVFADTINERLLYWLASLVLFLLWVFLPRMVG